MAIILPVPKTSTIMGLNDHHPVALTSIIIRCFEKLIKDIIVSSLPPIFHCFSLLTLQIALRRCYFFCSPSELGALRGKKHSCKCCLLTSAFNTIISQHLVDKLGFLGFNTPLCN
uniref:Reverse transcriptase domain-containing protein n=1 Tax=Micrurus carvalhoi TaxID=3147026 RepID=A0A2H6MVH1_9SAUR